MGIGAIDGDITSLPYKEGEIDQQLALDYVKYSQQYKKMPGSAGPTSKPEEPKNDVIYTPAEDNEEVVKEVAEKLNHTFKVYGRGFNVSKHKPSGKLLVQVIDMATKAVLKEIPPKYLLDLQAKVQKLLESVVEDADKYNRE